MKWKFSYPSVIIMSMPAVTMLTVVTAPMFDMKENKILVGYFQMDLYLVDIVHGYLTSEKNRI